MNAGPQVTIYVSRFLADKDECMMTPNLCGQGKCVNTPGSYRCTCNEGFTYDPKTMKCTGEFISNISPDILGVLLPTKDHSLEHHFKQRILFSREWLHNMNKIQFLH